MFALDCSFRFFLSDKNLGTKNKSPTDFSGEQNLRSIKFKKSGITKHEFQNSLQVNHSTKRISPTYQNVSKMLTINSKFSYHVKISGLFYVFVRNQTHENRLLGINYFN